jgi:hypothetical protein
MSVGVRRRLGQAGRAAREVLPCLRMLARVADAARRSDRRRAGLALLEGTPAVRAGTPTSVHVRIVNPTARSCTLPVTVTGETDDGVPFRVDWSSTLAPGAIDDRWIVTSWDGDASLDATAPSLPADLGLGTPSGRWRVTAVAGDGAQLAIGGALVR